MSIYQKKHINFIQAAIDEAQKSVMSKKHGCVIVHNNKIVSRGYNYRVDKDKKRYIKYSIHAEESAILKLKCKHTETLNMYVVRIQDDDIRQSKPCAKCKQFIESIKNINKIYYTFENDIIK